MLKFMHKAYTCSESLPVLQNKHRPTSSQATIIKWTFEREKKK